jgi:hypothetical protein
MYTEHILIPSSQSKSKTEHLEPLSHVMKSESFVAHSAAGLAEMNRLFWYATTLLSWATGLPPNRTIAIPKNFIIGTATSAYQVEGAWNESGKF